MTAIDDYNSQRFNVTYTEKIILYYLMHNAEKLLMHAVEWFPRHLKMHAYNELKVWWYQNVAIDIDKL